MMATSFPLTIVLKEGKLRVISTLEPALMAPLLQRVIQELEVSYEQLRYEPELERGEDGEPSHLFETFEKIDADALALLTGHGDFIFILHFKYELNETEKFQKLMREKLSEYLARGR